MKGIKLNKIKGLIMIHDQWFVQEYKFVNWKSSYSFPWASCCALKPNIILSFFIFEKTEFVEMNDNTKADRIKWNESNKVNFESSDLKSCEMSNKCDK